MSLPVTGQANWGVPLNQYITNAVLAVANQALTSINTHTSATDPHGDRAYAAGLVSPITSGVNQPNGYVVLSSTGKLPASMLPSGSGLSNYFDVKANYGATGNGTSDDSTAIQNALNDCATAGGGEVWVADGIYAIGSQLVIGANTWLHLSPGATIRRIIPTAGSAPSVMLSNVSFATGTSTPASGNIWVSGGKWDAVGSGLTSNCTPIMFVQASFTTVTQTFFIGVAGNPHIELNGSTYVTVRDCVFSGTTLAAGGGIVPAIRLNSTSTSTTPAGILSSIYNNTVCSNIMVASCTLVAALGGHPSTNRMLGADLYAGFNHSVVTVTGCSTAGSPYDAYPPVDYGHVLQGLAFGNLWNVAAGTPQLDLTTTGSAFIGPSASGGTPPNVYVAGTMSFATGYAGAVVPETWHNLTRPSGWSDHSSTGTAGFRYKMLPVNAVMLQFDLQAPATPPADGTTIVTMPTAYSPTVTTGVLPLATSNLTASGAQSPHLIVQPGGAVKVYGVNGSAVLQGTIIYPLD